jgi:hypothetical protein
MHKDSDSTSYTQYFSIRTTLREIIHVKCDNPTEDMYALCGQNSEFLNVKAGGTDNSSVPQSVILPTYFLNYMQTETDEHPRK